MNKFKFLTWVGGLLVGVPTVLFCIIAIVSVSKCSADDGFIIVNKPNTSVIDTVYVEKLVEKIKVDTIYIKVPTLQPKVEVPKDTL
jgi:hypothetical protein